MSVEGLCAICENRTADNACDLCGQVVCDVHYETADGLCAECEARSGGRPAGDERRDRDDVDEFTF